MKRHITIDLDMWLKSLATARRVPLMPSREGINKLQTKLDADRAAFEHKIAHEPNWGYIRVDRQREKYRQRQLDIDASRERAAKVAE